MNQSDPKPHVRDMRRFDLSTVSRCGAHARTTGRPCKAPAMKNGRCKLHGGRSTGPRTIEGKARIGATHRIHGKRTRQAKALSQILRELKKAVGQ